MLARFGCPSSILVLSALLISGCNKEETEKIQESITVLAPEQVGKSQAPVPEIPGDLDITRLSPGSGRVVAPGDLVRVRITPQGQAIAKYFSKVESDPPWDAWLWVGKLEKDFGHWGNFGSANLRAALIGRGVQERFRVQLGDRAEKYLRISLDGAEPSTTLHPTARNYSPTERRLKEWPILAVSKHGSLDIEILNACPARVYHRMGLLKRIGKAYDMKRAKTVNHAEAQVGWTILEGDCDGPTGKVSIEVGPMGINFAIPYAVEPPILQDWFHTYARMRPPEKYPHEYESDAVLARELPRRRIVRIMGDNQYTDCDRRLESWYDPYPKRLDSLPEVAELFPVNYVTYRTKDGYWHNYRNSMDCMDQAAGRAVQVEIVTEPGLRDFRSLAGNFLGGTLAIRSGGTLWHWGTSSAPGQLNWRPPLTDEIRKRLKQGEKYELPIENVQSVASSYEHQLYLKPDGTVWSTGANYCGQRGWDDDTKGDYQRVEGLPKITAIAAGYSTSFALDVDGQVWVWGHIGENYTRAGADYVHCRDPNNPEQGKWEKQPEPFRQPVPQRVEGLSEVTKISAQRRHLLALKKEGTVWAWGHNDCGQLGIEDGWTNLFHPTAVQVEGLSDIKDIAAGDRFSTALRADGKVWSWGHMTFFQGQPDRVPQEFQLKRVFARENKVTKRMTTCRSAGWSISERYEPRPVPELVPGVENGSTIYAGPYTAMTLTHDGKVWVWGSPEFLP